MSDVKFKPIFNIVSMYNKDDNRKINCVDKISVTESNQSFDKIISYKTRKRIKSTCEFRCSLINVHKIYYN